MKKTFTVLVALLLVVGLFVTGCSAGQKEVGPAAPSKVRDTVRIALQGEPSTLDAQYSDEGNMRMVTSSVFEGLTAVDGKTLQPIPLLATEWKTIDPTTWEFTLRDGVKFHNGDPFTAEDAAWSVMRMISKELQSQIASDFVTIKEAKVVAPNKIQIITNTPDPILLKRLTVLVMMDRKYTEANPKDIVLKPVGTGPYKVTNWARGTSIEMEAFDNYWGTKPAIKYAKFRFIEEASTRLAALKAGEIDFAVNMLPEYIKDMPKVATEKSMEISWIRFNQLRGPMLKKEVRLAANYAIDRASLAKDLYLGAAEPVNGQMGKPGYTGYDASLQPYPYDKAKAQELLKKAGYNGEVVEFVSERGRWLKDGECSEAVAAMLSDAGFNVKLKFVAWQEWLDMLFKAEKHPAMQFSGSGNEYFDYDRVYSTYVMSKGSQSSFKDPEIDKKINAARAEMDPAKRQAMYEELDKYFYDNPFGIYLLNMKDIYGMSKDLNWVPRQDSRLTVYEMSYSN